MKLAYQKKMHDQAVRQSLKVYDYYLTHCEDDTQDEIARHFGHSREWLRQCIIRAKAYYREHPEEMPKGAQA